MNKNAFKVGRAGQKRLLAIDGGGVRGILAIEILSCIEAELRCALKEPEMVLSDYFDYIAGTSTGGIIAVCLALGMTIKDIRQFYLQSSAIIFQRNRNPFSRAIFNRYKPGELERILKDVLGETTTLGSEKLKSLLMLVMLNASTCSPWPVSSNPRALYNLQGEACNLDMPLWQLVRASTAAPMLFPPELIRLGGKSYQFRDGAVTSLNNPALKLFQMATLRPYQLGWETGARKMLLISVGTGSCPAEISSPSWRTEQIAATIEHSVKSLMAAGSAEQDLWCRALGNCVAGEPLDGEVGSLIGEGGLGNQPLFTYARYNAELTLRGLEPLGCQKFAANKFLLDDVRCIPDCQEIGRAVARNRFQIDQFEGFL